MFLLPVPSAACLIKNNTQAAIVEALPVLHRGAAQHSCQLLFENVSFLRRFGLPRSQVEYSNVWNRLSDAEQASKWSSITKILQV